MFNKVIMDGVLDAARISAFAFIMSVANDVTTFFVLIVLFGALNFVVGLVADLRAGKPYSHRKAFHAFFEYAIAAVVITFTAAAARLIQPGGDYTYILRLLTTLFALVYAKNIIRNFKLIQPDNEFITVLDMLINTKYIEFVKNLKNGVFHNKGADKVGDGGSQEDRQHTDEGSGSESDGVDK
ncbi:hypothetical protein BC679P4_00005 [Bacteroides phage BC679P4]|nr:hypothetical protein BC679P1_00005 [Bacteroides phage BC679P1]WAX05909.1 hypothetical protein BC679P4_00005 [Bacteroides phage BC679P4]